MRRTNGKRCFGLLLLLLAALACGSSDGDTRGRDGAGGSGSHSFGERNDGAGQLPAEAPPMERGGDTSDLGSAGRSALGACGSGGSAAVPWESDPWESDAGAAEHDDDGDGDGGTAQHDDDGGA